MGLCFYMAPWWQEYALITENQCFSFGRSYDTAQKNSGVLGGSYDATQVAAQCTSMKGPVSIGWYLGYLGV